MPDEKAQATAQRRIAALAAIQRLSGPGGKWVTVSEVAKALKAEGYKAETHSVRRDLDALLDVYSQLELNDNSHGNGEWKRGLAYGCRWIGRATPPAGGLSLAEALSLVLVERYLSQALPATLVGSLGSLFEKAAHTLDLHKKSPAAHWADKIAVVQPAQPLIPPEIDGAVQQAVHEALVEERQLRVSYHRLNQGESPEQILHPQGLIQRGPATYLAAMAWNYDDVRLYALHRMRSAQKLDEPCRALIGFDIAHYAEEHGHFGSGEPIRLAARVSPGLRSTLVETKLSADQSFSEPDVEGWCEMTATVRNTWQLRWWVLSQTGRLQLLNPNLF